MPNVSVTARTWTQATTSDDVFLRRASTTQPTGTPDGDIRMSPGGVVLNEELADLDPGRTGGRVWLWCGQTASVSVSRA